MSPLTGEWLNTSSSECLHYYQRPLEASRPYRTSLHLTEFQLLNRPPWVTGVSPHVLPTWCLAALPVLVVSGGVPGASSREQQVVAPPCLELECCWFVGLLGSNPNQRIRLDLEVGMLCYREKSFLLQW